MDSLSTNSKYLRYSKKHKILLETCNITPMQMSDETNNEYKVLSFDEVVQYVVDFVQKVNCIVNLNSTVTRTLLTYCKWDKSFLMDKFYTDPEKLFKEARVVNPFVVAINKNSLAESECKICFSELLSNSKTTTNGCGHRFCTSCWSEYLNVKIMDDGLSNSILCAATDCYVFVDDEIVIELVEDLPAKRKYQRLIANSLIQQNQLFRWCPSPGCSFAVKKDCKKFKPISCSCQCGHEFCFDCAGEWHAPAPYKKTIFPRRIDSAEVADEYILMSVAHFADHYNKINTCSNLNCSVGITKISIQRCTNCSTYFCWVCLHCYRKEHDLYGHMCESEPKSKNVPQEELCEVKPIDSAVKENILRKTWQILTTTRYASFVSQPGPDHKELWCSSIYTDYYNKYIAEDTNFDVAITRHAEIKQQLLNCDLKTEKLERFERLLILLAECRRTLKYSTIFAMYLKKVDQSLLFKILCQHLENATVKLASFIMSVNLLYEETPEYAPLQKICQQWRDSLLNYIDEGFSNEWWHFEELPMVYDIQ